MDLRPLHIGALILAIIGAINWGLVGLFQFDLVASLFGGVDATMSRIVYSLVGLAGVTLILTTAAMYSGPTRTVDNRSTATR